MALVGYARVSTLDIGCGVALVVDQILAADQLQKARPMLRIGTACRQVDKIVGAVGLTRIDAAGRVVGRRPARCRLAGARLRDVQSSAPLWRALAPS